MKKKRLLNFNLILVLIWMIAVFMFSSQDSTKSLSLSSEIIVKINNLEDNKTKADTEIAEKDVKDEIEEKIINEQQFTVRKLAHFILYLIGGIFILSYIKTVIKGKNKQIIISLIMAIIYAITDEIHQMFVPGRSSKILDVCIDSTGAFCGIILFIIICKICENIKMKKNNSNKIGN